MKNYHLLLKRLSLNYLNGSFVAVFGIGAISMFMSLQVNYREFKILLAVIIVSALVMIMVEFIFFLFHVEPIQRAYQTNFSIPEVNENAILQLYKFPKLTVKRILGPHYLSFSLTASVLAYFLIKKHLLTFPMTYIIFAYIAAFIIASLHALFEFYLTSNTVKKEIQFIQSQINTSSTVSQETLIPIKLKLRVSILLIGVFPIILFLLAAMIKLTEINGIEVYNFLKWAFAILVITVFYSLIISKSLSKDIESPIQSLLGLMKEVETSDYRHEKNPVYLDEFTQLFQGFNKMVAEINERGQKNEMLLQSFLTVLSTALDARDPYTSGHSLRVAEYSKRIGKKIGLTKEENDQLFRTALLHDIGKIGVPDHVLLKDGALTEEEFAFIKAHPVIGETILKQVQPKSEIEYLLPGVRHHHERLDGKGYPDQLRGNEIPLFGRIIAVADSYDAMTSDRPYRKGMPSEKAKAILLNGCGTQWDSDIVNAFISILNQRTVDKEFLIS